MGESLRMSSFNLTGNKNSKTVKASSLLSNSEEATKCAKTTCEGCC